MNLSPNRLQVIPEYETQYDLPTSYVQNVEARILAHLELGDSRVVNRSRCNFTIKQDGTVHNGGVRWRPIADHGIDSGYNLRQAVKRIGTLPALPPGTGDVEFEVTTEFDPATNAKTISTVTNQDTTLIFNYGERLVLIP